MERRSGRRSSSAGSEKMERVGDREKMKRPKPTAGCSANGRRRSINTLHDYVIINY
jgi:hypothetical protein